MPLDLKDETEIPDVIAALRPEVVVAAISAGAYTVASEMLAWMRRDSMTRTCTMTSGR